MPKTLQGDKIMGCQHGRPQGSPCPHCLGINNPEDNQLENKDWRITIGDKINRYREGYGQLTHILEDIQQLLDTQQKEIREQVSEEARQILDGLFPPE